MGITFRATVGAQSGPEIMEFLVGTPTDDRPGDMEHDLSPGPWGSDAALTPGDPLRFQGFVSTC